MKIATHDLGREPNEFICWNCLTECWRENKLDIFMQLVSKTTEKFISLVVSLKDPKEFSFDNLSYPKGSKF